MHRGETWMLSRLSMILSAVLLMYGVARAEHKLLITDVLDKGQVEAEADIGYSYSTNNFTVKPPFFQQGKVVHRVTFTDLSLDLGIGHGVQIGISAPYVFSDRLSFGYSNPPRQPRYARTEGWGDIALGARYRLPLGDENPFTLVAGMDIKLDTANADKEGSGTTDYSPYLAAGTIAGGGKLRPYAFYRAVLRNHDAGDIHILEGGAEYAATKRVSLVPFVEVDYRTDSDSIKGYESFTLGLRSYIQAVRNFYLIPSVSYGIATSTRTTSGSQDLYGGEGYSVALGLYCLFN